MANLKSCQMYKVSLKHVTGNNFQLNSDSMVCVIHSEQMLSNLLCPNFLRYKSTWSRNRNDNIAQKTRQ